MEILLRQKIRIIEVRIYTDGELKFSQLQKIPLFTEVLSSLMGPSYWLVGW